MAENIGVDKIIGGWISMQLLNMCIMEDFTLCISSVHLHAI